VSQVRKDLESRTSSVWEDRVRRLEEEVKAAQAAVQRHAEELQFARGNTAALMAESSKLQGLLAEQHERVVKAESERCTVAAKLEAAEVCCVRVCACGVIGMRDGVV
jgi:hypothetical protein